MKKLIRLTESDLHKIIKESVKRVIKEAHGYVSHDGNGMVGGAWGSSSYKANFQVYNYIDNALYDAGFREGNPEYDEVKKYLYYCDEKGIFTISVDYEESYDYSVGNDGDWSIEGVDNEGIDRAREALQKMPTSNPKIKQIALQGFEEGIDKLLNDKSIGDEIEVEYPDEY